jgi:thiaminase/transcriptional activator TenA
VEVLVSPQDLLARHPELWRRATRHPFLDGVRDGSLPEEAFRRWLVQDYHFVRGLLPAQAYVLAASPRPDQRVLASGLAGLAEELDWFEQHARSRGLSLEVALHPTCRAYVDFLQGLRELPYAAQITALWACERAYLDAWTSASPGAPAYREFVEHWTQPGFAEYVAGLEACARRALGSASASERATAEEAFCRVADYEAAFWEMTWEGGRR